MASNEIGIQTERRTTNGELRDRGGFLIGMSGFAVRRSMFVVRGAQKHSKLRD
jgi:hypothetical protein